MVQRTTNGPFPQVRIDSWKSIARYLGKSSRTVQRWHIEYGLPVHRLGINTGSVFAYADELDAWLRNRGRAPKSILVEMPRPAPPNEVQLQPESDQLHRILHSTCISDSGKAYSAALVAFAYKLWANLSNENLKLIARCFREAIDLDPGNAEAFAGLSHTLIAEGLMGNLRIPDAYLSAKAALERAVEIDAKLPEAKCAAAWLKMVLEKDWRGARRGFDDSLNPQLPFTYANAMEGKALLHIAEGCPREASGLLQEAVLLSALNARTSALYCWSKYLAEDYWTALDLVEEARASGQSGPIFDAVEALASVYCETPDAYVSRIEALAANSSHPGLLRGVLGYVFALNGQDQRAGELLDALTHPDSGKKNSAPYAIALVLTGLNEKRDATQWLEQCYQSGSLWSLGFPADPILASLRDEPSYLMFLRKAGYPFAGSHRLQVSSLPPVPQPLRVAGA